MLFQCTKPLLMSLSLLGVFLAISCSSPKVTYNSVPSETVSEAIDFYEVSNILIKNNAGKKVYRGRARIYRECIEVPNRFGRGFRIIPNSEIESVYARFRWGGLSVFALVTTFLFVDGLIRDRDYEYSDCQYCTEHGPMQAFYGLMIGLSLWPFTTSFGSLVLNVDAPIYEAPSDSLAQRKYFNMIDMIPESRWNRIVGK